MKKVFIFLLFIPYLSLAQSLNENPYLTYYLGNNLQESATGLLLGRNYTGFAKSELARNTPASWLTGFSLNHLPASARQVGYDNPFGQSYMRVASVGKNTTSLSFRGGHFGEMDTGLRGKYQIDKRGKLNTGIFFNYHHYKGERDRNEDGFRDLAHKQKYFIINSWGLKTSDYEGTLTAYHLRLNETGGQIGFDKEQHYLGNQIYGMGTVLQQTGLGIRNSFFYNDWKTGKRIGTLFIDADMRQSSITRFYGQNTYSGQEEIWNTYIGYSFSKRMTDWEFGLRYRGESNNEYTELFSHLFSYKVQELGSYFKVQSKVNYLVRLEAGLRTDYDFYNKKALLHPNIGLTYLPFKNGTIKLFASKGRRQASPLAENNRYLFSSRQVLVPKALQAEEAWQYGMSFRWKWDDWVGYDFFTFGNFKYYLLFYHNIYQNIILAEPGGASDSPTLTFHNHDGKAYQTSLNNRVSFVPFRQAHFMMMHRFEVFRTDAFGEMQDRLFRPRNSFMLAFDYSIMQRADISLQYHLLGNARTPEGSFPHEKTGKRSRCDISVKVPLNRYITYGDTFKRFDVIVGADNLVGKKSTYQIIGVEMPFSPNMDGGMTWGTPLKGRFYGGLRIDF